MKNSNQLNECLARLEERVNVLEQNVKDTTLFNARAKPIEKLKPLSEKEFLLEKNPKGDVQKTFFLGAFLEAHKGTESFTAEDLKEAFRVACEPVPANINDKITKNIAKGNFMEVKPKNGKKAWVLTSTGEAHVKRLDK